MVQLSSSWSSSILSFGFVVRLFLVVLCAWNTRLTCAFLGPRQRLGTTPVRVQRLPTRQERGQEQQILLLVHHRLPSTRSSAAELSLQAHHYKKVFVAGGSKGVGRHVIDELLQRKCQVVALVRDPATAEELNQLIGVTAVVGDAFVQKNVEDAMDGCDAAITTLGGTSGAGADRRVDYEGNNNVIESAGILGVTRIILVTSIGCGSSREAIPDSVFNTLKDALLAKEKAENVLRKYYTNSNWTIVRPGGLKSEPATGNAIVTEDTKAIGSIHREDVARLVVQILESPSTERKILSAIDPTISSAIRDEATPIEAFALA